MSRDNVRPLTTRLKLFCPTYLLSINFTCAYCWFDVSSFCHECAKNIFLDINFFHGSTWLSGTKCACKTSRTVNGENPHVNKKIPCNLLVATLNITFVFLRDGKKHIKGVKNALLCAFHSQGGSQHFEKFCFSLTPSNDEVVIETMTRIHIAYYDEVHKNIHRSEVSSPSFHFFLILVDCVWEVACRGPHKKKE